MKVNACSPAVLCEFASVSTVLPKLNFTEPGSAASGREKETPTVAGVIAFVAGEVRVGERVAVSTIFTVLVTLADSPPLSVTCQVTEYVPGTFGITVLETSDGEIDESWASFTIAPGSEYEGATWMVSGFAPTSEMTGAVFGGSP